MTKGCVFTSSLLCSGSLGSTCTLVLVSVLSCDVILRTSLNSNGFIRVCSLNFLPFFLFTMKYSSIVNGTLVVTFFLLPLFTFICVVVNFTFVCFFLGSETFLGLVSLNCNVFCVYVTFFLFFVLLFRGILITEGTGIFFF